MAFKTQDHENMKLFKNRLWSLMQEKEIYTAKELAKKLYDKGYVSVKQKESFDVPSIIYGRAIGTIEKKIQKHLNSDSTEKLQGEFVAAYCKLFGCSSDYLFGNIECKNHDIQFIHNETGLSEDTINNLRHFHLSSDADEKNSIVSLNKILEIHRTYYELLPNITNYVKKCSEQLETESEIRSILIKSRLADIPVCGTNRNSDTPLRNTMEKVDAASYKAGISFANVIADIAKALKQAPDTN